MAITKAKRTLQAGKKEPSLAAIFSLLWRDAERMPAPMARGILKMELDTDQNRIRSLMQKNRDTGLTPAEDEELDTYIAAGDVLAILKIQARRKLKIKFDYNAHD